MPGLTNPVRREQTLREVDRLAQAIPAWLQLRRENDQTELGRYAGLHETRLNAIESVLSAALKALCQAAHALDDDLDGLIFYDRCRVIDRALVWLGRVFAYYQEKFDQRDPGCPYAPFLRAADEIIWSCYHQVYVQKTLFRPGTYQLRPAPLAYLAPEYSPYTLEANKLTPGELRPGGEIKALEEMLLFLPVPVIRLPPWCLSSPWWLAFTAHEVGHNIQRELNLVTDFGNLLFAAVTGAGRPAKPDGERWRRWGSEIFADLFSLVMLGSPALRALAEIESSTPAQMRAPRGDYPPALLRLKLAARALEILQFDPADALPGIDLTAGVPAGPDPGEPAHTLESDLKLVEPVLKEILGPLWKDGPSLAELCSLDQHRPELSQTGRAGYWADHLTAQPSTPTKDLISPRYLCAGAVWAWEKAAALTDKPARTTAFQNLADNLVALLPISGPEGTRAGPAELDGDLLGAQLADQLLKTAKLEPEG